MEQALPDLAEVVTGGFGGGTALVVGDLMLDRYLRGGVQRISPEAPVPVLKLHDEHATPGGAANVARNLTALGLAVRLFGVTGQDPWRAPLLAALTEDGVDTTGVLPAPGRKTTVKTRVIGNHQQMLRIDEESLHPLSDALTQDLFNAITAALDGARVLLLSDYAKGTLSAALCQGLITRASGLGIPVLVDPKGADFARYAGASVITPNRGELALATQTPTDDLHRLLAAGHALRDALGIGHLLVTLGEQGMALLDATGEQHIPAEAREVYDVSGAGDTAIATFAAAWAAGLSPLAAARVANLAAGIVVGKVGTAAVGRGELLAALRHEHGRAQADKICDLREAEARVRAWQAAGERVVFTNGCFDLLHVGHVAYLEGARHRGHRLVVGLNSDRSVRALKGPARPLIPEGDRARVLAALAAVDAVVLFDEDTPLDLILRLRPEVLAKGADYRPEEVVGATEVRGWGGQLVLLPLVEDRSTSGILRTAAERGGSPYP